VDLFTDAQLTHQLTSTDPGNIPGGLFWTIAARTENVEVNLERKTASLVLHKVATKDFGTLLNDLQHGPSVPATVSFNVRWGGLIEKVKLRDPVNKFALDGFVDTAVMTCRASVPSRDIEFVSDPANTSKTTFAEIGQERNGRFFANGHDRAAARHATQSGVSLRPGMLSPRKR
jgi:hypothetical protein